MKKLQSVSFAQVDITGGFWKRRQQINARTSVYSVWERFRETGRFDALNFDWNEQKPYKPHIFWDSDIVKWIESVAYLIEKEPDPILEAAADEAIEKIAAHQGEDGYFNIWFTVVEPEERWKKRTHHELYCAGHLMEAAVAYHYATGKDRLLDVARRYADEIYRVFLVEHSAAFSTPGHEEIELALVKLFRCTREPRYLELARYFIDQRGNAVDAAQHYPWANPKYAQDHLPVRQQRTAEGHAVRACYLYCAMADLAYQCDDEELFEACHALFDNIVSRRMYITGGIGSSQKGEAFTIDYDLPNLSAYSESCAAIALAFFARRMARLEIDSRYADTVERIWYNGFLSSQSLDGRAFFYENPLEIDPRLHTADASVGDGTTRYPITQRKEVFDCSCCPPNITRFLASMGDFLYNFGSDTLYLHQFVDSFTVLDWQDHEISITQNTRYPEDGTVHLRVTGMQGKTLAVRLPGWCRHWQAVSNGRDSFPVAQGYIRIPILAGEQEITLVFDMPVEFIEAAPQVQIDSGRVAVQRGPVVYCLEAVDNGSNLRDLVIDSAAPITLEQDEGIGLPVLRASGWRRVWEEPTLYRSVQDLRQPQSLRLIPYFAFANRGESEMLVWVQKR